MAEGGKACETRPLLCWGLLSVWGGEQVGLVSTWEQGIQDTGGDCQPVKELSGERQGELQEVSLGKGSGKGRGPQSWDTEGLMPGTWGCMWPGVLEL